MRALMPGYNVNYYKDGNKPCHTKRFFTDYKILTVHSIILTNILIFMHKYNEFRNLVPLSVSRIISPDALKNAHVNEKNIAWMARHTTDKSRNNISFKGPLFYSKYMPEILEKNNIKYPCNAPINFFKKHAKSFIFEVQNCGSQEEWEGRNTPLYNVPGLPRVYRENIPKVSYMENDFVDEL